MAQESNREQVRAAGDLVVQSRRQVMKAAQSIDPFSEIGTTGLRQFGGFVLEEWLQSLTGRRGAWVWREMQDNDPTVGAILFAIRWLAMGVDWRVEEGGDPAAAELVESAMHDMDHTWGDFVSEALSFMPYGWALHEEVLKKRQGYRPEAPFDPADEQRQGARGYTSDDESSQPASSKYDDGKIGWRKLPIRAQETLLRWHFDGVSNVRAMHQIDWHGGQHVIPLSKALLFRTVTSRNNPEGRSLMRNAFTSYTAIKQIKQLEGIGIERDLAGIPVATPPENVDLFAPSNKALLVKVQAMVTAVRRDEYDGIVLPSAGWKFELVKAAGSRQIEPDKAIRRYRQDIAASMLADWVLLGMDAVGSYAMVDVKSDLFGLALDGILDLICEVMNRTAIPRLLVRNGMDASEPPRLAHGSAGRINLEKVGAFLNALYLAGAPIPWSLDLLKALFLEAGLPANFEEQERPDGSDLWVPDSAQKPEAKDPGSAEAQQAADSAAQDAERQAQGDAEEADRSQQIAKTVPLAKADVHQGAMVALYPSGDVAAQLAQDGGEPAEELHLTLAFLGPASGIENVDELRQAVALWAARTPPLHGQVSGVGHFTAGPEPVTYASADIPELPGARERLVSQLQRVAAPSREHGFTPHITLAYEHRQADVANHPLSFDHATLKLAGKRHDFPLAGVRSQQIAKAEHEKVRQGTIVHVAAHLEQRARLLSAQLDQEIRSAFSELGEQAALAFLSSAEKAALGSLHRIVGRIMAALNIRNWVRSRLEPLMRSHAGRTMADTQRTLRTEIGIELGIGEREAQSITASAGQRLGMRDIEAQVRQQILQAVRDGLAAGDNPTRTAQRIREMVPAGRFVHAGPRYRAQLISRDQTANLQRASTLALYQSNPRVTHIRLRDGVYGPPRSDADCIERDGEIVPVADAADALPEHPLCTLGFEPVVTGVLRTPAPEPIPALAA